MFQPLSPLDGLERWTCRRERNFNRGDESTRVAKDNEANGCLERKTARAIINGEKVKQSTLAKIVMAMRDAKTS